MSVSNKPRVPVEVIMYIHVLLFSAIIFGGFYFYTTWLQIPNAINKAFADSAIAIMGLSMLLSSLAYFFNFFKPWLMYRKHLGLVGFALLLVHIGLSFSALQALFDQSTWIEGDMYPALTGLLATVIFTYMAVISNHVASRILGGTLWRLILRTGYIALALSLIHVVLLKSARWVIWYNGGMQTLPSASLLVSIGAIIVIVMRGILWIALKKKSR